ncbi:MAG: RecX family transcriptional regulator [Clostridia bacterium]|nr:RecX family transcriptional regulator [Clostridia bacterium]
MKVITDIKAQVKNPTRCSIYLDNVFYCGLELETVMRHRLKVGDQIEPEKLDEIQFDSERVRALDKALSFVTNSKKTQKQVREHLYKRGYTEQTVESVIQKMNDYRFLDDGDYAESYAKSYSKTKGKRLIAMELKIKGVSEESIQKALEDLGDQTENAVSVAEKYLKNKPKDKQNIQKCYKYLLSKGFEYDVAKSAVGRIGEYEDD